jgi:Na+/H+-dicarboxylate symporter
MGVAFVAGAIAGWILGPRATVLQPLGEIFVRLLTSLVLPLLVCTIVTALGAVSPRQLGRVGIGIATCYGLMALVGAALGLGSALLMHPGSAGGVEASNPQAAPPPPTSFVSELVPVNVVAAAAAGQYLGVVVFTVPFALAIGSLRQSRTSVGADDLYALFDAFGAAAHALLRGIMLYAPVGAFALTAVTFSRRNSAMVAQFANVLATLFAAELIAGIALLAIIATSLPRGVSRTRLKEVLITAFTTGSSAATLPVEMDVAENGLALPRQVVSLAIPPGIGVSKAGSAIYIAVVTIFALNTTGRLIAPTTLALIGLLAAVGSIATPPAAGGALLVLGFVFSQVGIPLQLIAVIAAIPEAGRLNTPVNSLGRLAATAVVARLSRRSQNRV